MLWGDVLPPSPSPFFPPCRLFERVRAEVKAERQGPQLAARLFGAPGRYADDLDEDALMTEVVFNIDNDTSSWEHKVR